MSEAVCRSGLCVVIRLSLVITSSIRRDMSRWKRRSRLVTIPIRVLSGITTGIPPIRFSFISTSASPTVLSLPMVIGS